MNKITNAGHTNTTNNKTRVFRCLLALVLLLRHSWTELADSAAVPDSWVWLQAWICPYKHWTLSFSLLGLAQMCVDLLPTAIFTNK